MRPHARLPFIIKTDSSREPSLSGQVTATSSDTAKLTNTDRLRAHLAANGLASKLLDAWLAGPNADAQARMLPVVNALDNAAKVSDAGSTPSKA